MKSFLEKPSSVKRLWYELDASKQSLGRLASRAATLLRGKHKATFTPHTDGGDFVVVTNAKNIQLTGRKATQKVYHTHSGYPGGIRSKTLQEKLLNRPEEVIFHAISRMLAANRLRKPILRRLKIVGTGKHNFKIDKHG